MKTQFSEFQFTKGWRKTIRGRQHDADRAMRHLMMNNPTKEEAIAIECLHAQTLMLTGHGTDIFLIGTELPDLIMGMVREFTADILDVFAEDRNTALVIHPVSPRPAVLVGIRTAHGKTNAFFHEGGRDADLTSALGWEDFSNGARRKPNCYGERLAIGLALYMRFFPQAVKNGIPEEVNHPAHYKGTKCRTVGIANELVDRSGPKPHFRTAHYRFLGSEKFTHKRGQLVPVIGSFVRGKCKIVVEVET